jgi:hypothetical protein
VTEVETRLRVEFTVPPDLAEQRRMFKTVHRRLFRVFFWIAIGLAVAAFLYTVLVIAILREVPIYEPVAALVLAVWAAAYPRGRASRVLRASPTYCANPVIFEISEVAAGETSAVGHLSARWAAVTSVVETSEFWVLMADRRARLVLPRRHIAATDEAAIRTFMVGRGLVPEHTPEG